MANLMNISTSTHSYPTSVATSGNNFPPNPETQAAPNHIKDNSQKNNLVDLNNISRNEINSLIRSGVDGGLLDHLPIKSILDDNGNLSSGGGYQADEKFDLISSMEQLINYKKSINRSTEADEHVLEKYMAIHKS